MVGAVRVHEVAGGGKFTVGAGVFMLAAAAGVGVDVALAQLLGDLLQELVHVLPQFPQLRC